MSGRSDADDYEKRYKTPYNARRKIPTIAGYREEKEARQAKAGLNDSSGDEDGNTRGQRAWDAYYRHRGQESADEEEGEGEQGGDAGGFQPDTGKGEGKDEGPVDTSQADLGATDPKQRRKQMKRRSSKQKEQRAEREVTDPITHLPVTIHDFTNKALEEVEENGPAYGDTEETATGIKNKKKSDEQLKSEEDDMRKGSKGFDDLFPPPEFDVVRTELLRITKKGIWVGLGGSVAIMFGVVAMFKILGLDGFASRTESRSYWRMSVWLGMSGLAAGGIWAIVAGVKDWISNRLQDVWDEEVWDADRQRSNRAAEAHQAESTTWLNSLIGSVWPLINPDLFTGLADTLEDVMQASLPKVVRMVSVDDIGQGSENLRILGVRWLPTGAASRAVDSSGELAQAEDGEEQNKKPKKGTSRDMDRDGQDDDTGENVEQPSGGDNNEDGDQQGMEAEEGDFVNVEIAFAYKARSTSKSFRDRTKDMHMLLAFYLPGNLKVPIWVDLRGIIGTMRVRLQLAPDPPFFAMATITFLGQPKVDLSCIPLSRRAFNIMDIPLISNFVQSSVDAAMAEYVAPKSLALDLKGMLAGDDFKKDTTARGILVVTVKRGYDFKVGDTGIPFVKDGSTDPYVSIAWAKFGKPIWSTRLLMSEMEPSWQETAYILVTPEELNVDERIRLQLWDSDRMSADDDLGRIEVDLKSLMKSEASNGKMQNRTDGFRALQAGEEMPGQLEWSVGYFSKTRIQACQLQKQNYDPEVRTMQRLHEKVEETTNRKLREAKIKGDKFARDESELEQQKAQELKSTQDEMIIAAPPPDNYPSGILCITIHNITGLGLERLNKRNADVEGEASEEEEEGEGLPSAFCTVIINHRKAFKSRTKPKNSKPFFNAGTERFIPDWRNAEVFVSVRDARVHENDPLLGVVHLPLWEVFKHRSQTDGQYPLTGGVGYGRVRISMAWRSVQLQAPPEALGWSIGTLEVKNKISTDGLPKELEALRLRFTTNLARGKMYPNRHHEDGAFWHTKKGASLQLGVHQRYSSCVGIQLRHKGRIKDNVPAFAVLWLKDIPDDEEKEISLPVWKGDYDRATACCLEECGERVGELKMTLHFWSGMGTAHEEWALKDRNLNDIYEVLEVAQDYFTKTEQDQDTRVDVPGSEKTSSSADVDDIDGESTDTDDNDEDHPLHSRRANRATRPDTSARQRKEGESEEDEEGQGRKDRIKNGDSGPIDRIKDYKSHQRMLHRRNRGVLQWRIPRTAEWMQTKVESAEHKFTGMFKHHTKKQPNVETEV